MAGQNQLDLFGGALAPEPSAREKAKAAARAPIEPAVHPSALATELAALRRTLPKGLRMGTSSWAFTGWAGLVYDQPYPQNRLSREGLAAYAKHPLLRAVGVD